MVPFPNRLNDHPSCSLLCFLQMQEGLDSKQGGGRQKLNADADKDRVREWVRRKNEHVESPLAAAQRGGSSEPAASKPTDSESRRILAMVNGIKVAETYRPQLVNDRVYFPVEDCVLEFFQDSPKRWR